MGELIVDVHCMRDGMQGTMDVQVAALGSLLRPAAAA